MFTTLLLIFIIVPILEISVLLKVGALIGTGPTIALILATGIAGAYLARTQGLDLARQVQLELSQGRVPANHLIDGVLILAGGLLLLTPGFCTDIVGFTLLLPISRPFLKHHIVRILKEQIAKGKITIHRR